MAPSPQIDGVLSSSAHSSPAVSPHDRIYRAKQHHQYRPKDLVIGSDTESETGSATETQLSAASFTSLWNAYRQLERSEQFTSGAKAVLQVAGNISENVFLYPLLDTSSTAEEDAASASYRARVIKLEIRQGAADTVRGALAVGTSAAAFVPSQTLPLFLPNMFQIAQSQQSAVFHVSCEAIRADLAVGSSYESIYALQHSGALLLNSSNPQELHDLAVVAHVAALRLKKLLVHFYDGARVAKELTKLQVLAPSALKTLADIEQASPFVEVDGQDVAEHVQLVMDDLFQVLQKQYKVYEYYGAPDAEFVIVVMGEATAAIQEAVAYEQMLGNKVGVVQVRLLLPWSHTLFAAALPASVKKVAVLENISTGAFAFQRGLLTQNVQVFFHTTGASSSVSVVTGIYGGVFRNFGFSLGMGRAVFHHLFSTTTRRSFVVAKSEALYETALETATVFPQLDVIYGQAYDLSNNQDGYAKQYLFWGYDEQDQRGDPLETSYSATLELLNRNPSTQVHAVVTHSAPSVTVPRSVSTLEVRVALSNGRVASGLQQGIEQADVSVVTRAGVLKDFDVAASVKPNGTLLVHTSWKTIDDIDESALFKQQLASKNAHLLVVDLEELQKRVTDEQIASVGSQVAFLKAAGLFDEKVVFALLQAQFPVDKHATLRSFVSAVWGDVVSIVYPLNDWNPTRSYLSDDEEAVEVESSIEETAVLPTLNCLEPSKISHSIVASTSSTKRRARRGGNVSKDTQTAWKMVFQEAFATRQGVRDHVTDIVTVTKWERLTPSDYSRNVFHVEMDITNSAISYKIGEALAVFAHNDDKAVIKFLQSYNVDPDALVTLPVAAPKASAKKGSAAYEPMEETLTYFQLFAQVLDIFGRPSKKFYQALWALAMVEKEKDALTQLLEDDGKDEYKRRVDETLTYADLLDEFPSARPSMAQLLTLVPRIKPRHYSIASSMKMNPTSVHLLIVVHDWTTPSGTYRIGQATRFLADVKPGQLLSVSVCSSVMKLPVNHEDPIIMAGLGTGMAPFRAFIQERAFLKSKGVKVGPIALYFGARSKAQEFLYGEELEQYVADGLLTYLRCAFSRDQAHKIYIQDRISEDKEILGDWLLKQNGHFYLCGPTWPVADVREALVTSLISQGGLERKQANAYIERMREQGRYVLEVY